MTRLVAQQNYDTEAHRPLNLPEDPRILTQSQVTQAHQYLTNQYRWTDVANWHVANRAPTQPFNYMLARGPGRTIDASLAL